MSNPTEGEAAGIYLPPELISDILSRLSIKSIGRFRCVCHAWRALLSEQKFLKLQFSRQGNKSQNKFIGWTRAQPFSQTLLTIDFSKDSSSKVVAVGKIQNSELSRNDSYWFYGSCNGLILLGRRSKCNEWDVDSIIIRNPTTRESRLLPVVPSCFCGGGSDQYPVFHNDQYILGYDSTLDDFKVVLFRKTDFNIITCFVYTLKSNSWKKVDQNPPDQISYFGTCVDEANRWNAYWISPAWVRDIRVNMFAFDFTDEKFRVVELPMGLKGLDNHNIHAMRVNGRCPCLFNHRSGQPRRSTEVWVMRDNSWTKHLVTLSFGHLTHNSWFLWNDYELMVKMSKEKHMLYNLKSGISRELETRGEGLPRDIWNHGIHTFAESLFSPNCSN